MRIFLALIIGITMKHYGILESMSIFSLIGICFAIVVAGIQDACEIMRRAQ